MADPAGEADNGRGIPAIALRMEGARSNFVAAKLPRAEDHGQQDRNSRNVGLYERIRNRKPSNTEDRTIKHASVLLVIALSILVFVFGDYACAANPNISECPKVIYAVGGFDLEGTNFGTEPGNIHIHFLQSAVQLPNGVSTSELTLTPQRNGWAPVKIRSNEIALIYPIGAANDQPISITVSIKNDKITSNTCKAVFRSTPTIRDGSRNITPNQLFMLTGWNFGVAGTLSVHFLTPPKDLNVPIPSPSNNSWKPFGIMLKLPPVTGVIGQTVDIRFMRNDGRGSNVWKTTFTPTMALVNVPQQDVTLVTCSNAGVDNACSNGGSTSYFCLVPPIDVPGVPPGSFWGTHTGCGGVGSTNGTDTYSVTVKRGWLLDHVDFVPATQYDPCCQDNGSVYPNDIAPVAMSNYPNPYVFNVPWHIGPSGGWVNYGGYFVVDGPKGVPY